MKTITVEELRALLPSITLVDVREEDEFATGHIEEALSLPLSQLASNYQTLDTANPLYLICQKGARSARAAEFLASKNYDVTNVTGGMDAWNESKN